MKFSGDIPEEHRQLALKLEESELEIDNHPILPNERKAQTYTCLAHDWYQISMEEEGNRLLLKAEKAYPGYFKQLIVEHASEDPNFKILVDNIAVILLNRMIDK